MKHQVTAIFAPRVLNKKDIEFVVKSDGRKLGKLLVSRGNIEWLPSGNHVHKWTMSWSRFAEVMQQEGKRRKI
jgi:hypothetical protein